MVEEEEEEGKEVVEMTAAMDPMLEEEGAEEIEAA